jgi:hypothetical protein
MTRTCRWGGASIRSCEKMTSCTNKLVTKMGGVPIVVGSHSRLCSHEITTYISSYPVGFCLGGSFALFELSQHMNLWFGFWYKRSHSLVRTAVTWVRSNVFGILHTVAIEKSMLLRMPAHPHHVIVQCPSVRPLPTSYIPSPYATTPGVLLTSPFRLLR